jgi:15-cis-phytoene synthase
MPPFAELEPLYRAAAESTAQGSKSFYFATRFFPPDLARAAHAVYWFCRHTDDLVDKAPSVEQGRRDLQDWERKVRAGLAGAQANHPVLCVFLDTVQAYGIPHDPVLGLIEGMWMDLNATRYRTFVELRTFCYRVASVVGVMMSHVIGFREGALPYAVDLGIAMQLTNILRDVGEDLRIGRVYLPADEMARFGYSEADLLARRRTPEFEDLMRFQIARARDYYRRAEPGIELLDSRGRFAVRIAADFYRAILSRIEANQYDVFSRRAAVPGPRKYWMTARAMALPAARITMTRMWAWRTGPWRTAG